MKENIHSFAERPIEGRVAKKRGKLREKRGDRVLIAVFYIFAAAFALLCLYPFYQVLISSFADETTLVREGYKRSRPSFRSTRTARSSAPTKSCTLTA